MTPQRSKLYFMKYQLADAPGEYLEISTTRPETLMGDVAVAVNPKDPRFAKHIGRKVLRPFPQAEIPIIADEHVDIEFGTGALKITPAHDKADFEIGKRHDLEIIDVLTPDGRIDCPECPELHGLDRFLARKKAAAMLEEMGLLLKVEEYENNVGFSERAHVPVEPRISMQWFLKYPCVKEAADAVANGDIKFRPERWAKTYAHWMENLQDWCISRQLWWGHQIPVWYRKDKLEALKNAESLDMADLSAGDIHVGIEPPADAVNWTRDEDVMDTWFSSWLWPFSTLGWPDTTPDLKAFYPGDVLVTAPEILFFWVSRMVMSGCWFLDQTPFHTVYLHGTVRDMQHKKMSKSLGNTIGLMETDDEIWAKLRPAMTDPQRVRKTDVGRPEVCNIFQLHKAFSREETVAQVDGQCRSAGWGCMDCKKVLQESMVQELTPIRGRAEALDAEPQRVLDALAGGAETARGIARETMREVRGYMGLDAVTVPTELLA